MTETGTPQPSPTHSEEERITALEAFAFRTGSDLGDIKQTLVQIVGKLEGIDARFDGIDARFDRMDTEVGLVRDDVRKNAASLEDIRGKVAATETGR